MGDVLLRPARPDEGNRLSALALRSKASNGYDAAFIEQCRAELTFVPCRAENQSTWLAEDGQSVVGFFEIDVDSMVAEIEGFFVEPDIRRRGVGRRLWRRLEAEAARLGAKRVAVDSDPAAVPFYQAMGMTIVGDSPSGSIAGRRLPRLEMLLNPDSDQATVIKC